MKRASLNKNNGLFYLFLLAWMIPAHVIGIDQFLTVDEPWWVISGSNFYYALTHEDFENTIYDYHPAVTTTWLVTGGMLSYFPEYRGFGQGYFDVRKPDFEEFMRLQGKEAIHLVRNSRLIQTSLLVALAILSFFLLQTLIDQKAAFLAIALSVNAPFFLGHARLLNHEGMLTLFVLVSLLSMQVYLYKPRLIYLLISGAAFGLAQLTKSSSIVLIPLIGFMLLIELIKRDGKSWGSKVWSAVNTGVVWLAVAILVYVALWPGMWSAPGKMLSEIYGNAFSYAFQGARLDITGELETSSFNLASGLFGVLQYVGRWATSSTWVTWLGILFIFVLVGVKDKKYLASPVRTTLFSLAALAMLFILIFGVAQGRDSTHYILSSFVCLDVMAGIGWAYFLMWAKDHWGRLDRAHLHPLTFVILMACQLGSALPYYPYYYTYKNLFADTPSTYGYGEGLEQAATYLAQKPDAQETHVYAYAGLGPFSFFYPGKTEMLKKIYFYEDLSDIAAGMRRADYLVLYSAVQNTLPNFGELSQALQSVQPEKVIFIHEEEYIRIYKLTDIPEQVFEDMTR